MYRTVRYSVKRNHVVGFRELSLRRNYGPAPSAGGAPQDPALRSPRTNRHCADRIDDHPECHELSKDAGRLSAIRGWRSATIGRNKPRRQRLTVPRRAATAGSACFQVPMTQAASGPACPRAAAKAMLAPDGESLLRRPHFGRWQRTRFWSAPSMLRRIALRLSISTESVRLTVLRPALQLASPCRYPCPGAPGSKLQVSPG